MKTDLTKKLKMMTIKELIEKLQEFDGDLVVLCNNDLNYSNNLCNPKNFIKMKVSPDNINHDDFTIWGGNLSFVKYRQGSKESKLFKPINAILL